MYHLGARLHADGRLDDAEKTFRELLGLREEKLGADHPDSIAALDALCETLCGLRRYDEAMELLDEELRLCEKAFGFQHERTIKTLKNTANVYRMKGDPYLAISVLMRALELNEKAFGRKHPSTTAIHDELAKIRGPRDTLGMRQALAAKHGLPIPGDLLANRKSIDMSKFLQKFQSVSGIMSRTNPEVTNATAMRLAKLRGERPRPVLEIPGAFDGDISEMRLPVRIRAWTRTYHQNVPVKQPCKSCPAEPCYLHCPETESTDPGSNATSQN